MAAFAGSGCGNQSSFLTGSYSCGGYTVGNTGSGCTTASFYQSGADASCRSCLGGGCTASTDCAPNFGLQCVSGICCSSASAGQSCGNCGTVRCDGTCNDPCASEDPGDGESGNTCNNGTDDGEGAGNVEEDDACSEDSDCDSLNNLYCGDDCRCHTPDYADPILIDLGGAGYFLTNLQNGVTFDITGNRKPRQLAWTAVGADVGFLVLDRNGDGRIDNGSELFTGNSPQLSPPQESAGSTGARSPGTRPSDTASVSTLPSQPAKSGKRLRKSGFAALAVYDQAASGGNGDGQIDANDAVYSRLRVWVDKNHDGISQPDEVRTLAELGITSISLSYQPAPWTDAFGNKFISRTAFTRERSDALGR